MAQPIPKTLRDAVRKRAKELCEYCHTNERWQYIPFTIDHIIPLSLGGIISLDNLALACFYCNRRKSNKIEIFDKTTGEPIALFNPRKMQWLEHFQWSDDFLTILPLTDTGRITVYALDLNRKRLKFIRAEDIAVNRHPPKDDLTERNKH
jgi:HNH endonuclease